MPGFRSQVHFRIWRKQERAFAHVAVQNPSGRLFCRFFFARCVQGERSFAFSPNVPVFGANYRSIGIKHPNGRRCPNRTRALFRIRIAQLPHGAIRRRSTPKNRSPHTAPTPAYGRDRRGQTTAVLFADMLAEFIISVERDVCNRARSDICGNRAARREKFGFSRGVEMCPLYGEPCVHFKSVSISP